MRLKDLLCTTYLIGISALNKRLMSGLLVEQKQSSSQSPWPLKPERPNTSQHCYCSNNDPFQGPTLSTNL